LGAEADEARDVGKYEGDGADDGHSGRRHVIHSIDAAVSRQAGNAYTRAGEPTGDRGLARSFKTFAARPGFLEAHTPGGRVRPPSAPLRFFSSPWWPRSPQGPATSC